MTAGHLQMGVLRWEDPPAVSTAPRTDDRVAWAIVAAELRSKPGEWAVVIEGPKAVPHVAIRISQGKSPWFRPAGSFETMQRTAPDGGVSIYARYVGEPAGMSVDEPRGVPR